MAKKVTSRPGLFGTTVHYDEKGRKIGESAPGCLETLFIMAPREKESERPGRDSSEAPIPMIIEATRLDTLRLASSAAKTTTTTWVTKSVKALRVSLVASTPV